MVIFPALMHYASSVSEPEVVGRNMSLYSASVNICLIAGPTFALTLSDRVDGEAPWLVSAIITAVAAMLIILVRPG